MDWNKIKAEYISGGTSYRKLAEKYGVSFSKIKGIAMKEHWVTLKEQTRNKTDTKLVDDISKQNAKTDYKYFKLVDKLLTKTEKLVDNTKELKISDVKELSITLKHLKDCKGIKSDADMREQEARIDKLRKEIDTDISKENKPYGVIMMPPIMEELIPPKDDDNG